MPPAGMTKRGCKAKATYRGLFPICGPQPITNCIRIKPAPLHLFLAEPDLCGVGIGLDWRNTF